MCHVCPPLWAFSDTEKNFNVTVRIGSLRLCHICSSFNLVRVAKRLACVRFYFQYQGLRRNPRIWWRVRTTFDDVIFTSNIPSHQVAIYWILKIWIFFRHNSPMFFSKVRLIPDSAWSDISKEPIKSGHYCKFFEKIRFSVTTGPIRPVHYRAAFCHFTKNAFFLPFFH